MSSSSSSSSTIRRVKRTVHKHKKSNTHVAKPSASVAQKVFDVNFPLRGTVGNNVYDIIQTGNSAVITSSGVANVYSAYYVSLNQFDQYTSLTAVFDQYRIRMVEATFRPRVTQETANSANTGLFATVIDVDDGALLTTFAQAEDYQTCSIGRGLECQTRTCIPHAAMALYSGAFSSYGNVASPWIDTSSSTVQHYGFKTAWTSTDVAYVMDVQFRAWFQFKNVR